MSPTQHPNPRPSTNRSKSSPSSECSSHNVHNVVKFGIDSHANTVNQALIGFVRLKFTGSRPHLSDGRQLSAAFRSMGFQPMFAVPRDFDRYSDRTSKSEALFFFLTLSPGHRPATPPARSHALEAIHPKLHAPPTSPLHAAPLDNRYSHHTIERGSASGSKPKCPETLSRLFGQTRKMCHHG